VARVCACVCVCAVNSAVSVTYNAALNRPAYLSSVTSSYVARLANDGNYGTTYSVSGRPRCAISRSEINPWWAVDLGAPTVVYRVDLTNTNTISHGKLRDYLHHHSYRRAIYLRQGSCFHFVYCLCVCWKDYVKLVLNRFSQNLVERWLMSYERNNKV